MRTIALLWLAPAFIRMTGANTWAGSSRVGSGTQIFKLSLSQGTLKVVLPGPVLVECQGNPACLAVQDDQELLAFPGNPDALIRGLLSDGKVGLLQLSDL